MKKILLILIALIGFAANAQSNQSEPKKNKNAKYSIDVNGNCEQCKKRIEKAAFGVGGVKSAMWNIESHKLDLILNEEKTSVATVKKALAKVGHDTDEFKATQADYDNLHHCCKYERD